MSDLLAPWATGMGILTLKELDGMLKTYALSEPRFVLRQGPFFVNTGERYWYVYAKSRARSEPGAAYAEIKAYKGDSGVIVRLEGCLQNSQIAVFLEKLIDALSSQLTMTLGPEDAPTEIDPWERGAMFRRQRREQRIKQFQRWLGE